MSTAPERLQSHVLQYAPMMHTFAYYMCGNTVEAINLVRQACRQFLTKYDQIDQTQSIEVVLLQNLVKGYKVRLRDVQEGIREPGVPQEGNLLQEIIKSPAAVQSPDFQKHLKEEIMQLPIELRLPIILSDYFTLARVHIASILGVPLSTIAFRISQARGTLIHAFSCQPAIHAH